MDEIKLPPGANFYDYSVRGRSILCVVASREYGYRQGFIATAHGVVGLYDQTDTAYTRLDFAIDGRCYSASWDRTFSDRFLKTLASRFAASVLAASEASLPNHVKEMKR